MGTTSEWLTVLLRGGLWGGLMAWVFTRDRVPEILKPKGRRDRILYVVFYVLTGLLFEFMDTFGWQRAVHTPLVFVSVAAMAGLFLVWASSARDGRKGHND
jgi:hypothetical protein